MFMADIKAEYLACPIRQVVSRFGDKWSMLVLYMLHTSETGVLRFNEIRHLMTDCSQKMLSQTLKNLEQSHLVHREVYPEVPPRVELPLYQKLCETKPEYGSNRHIHVKLVDGEIAITRSTLVALLAKNVHVGSLGDIITYPIDVDPDLNISKVLLLDAILDFDNLQKAKIVR